MESVINWSYSRLKDFMGCPRRHYETQIAKNFQQPYTQALRYGNAVHKALEKYAVDGTPLPNNYKRYQGYVDGILEIEGNKYPEYKMGLLPNRKACDYEDKNRWVRGIADMIIVDGDTAHIVDYKTGKADYPDPMQLKLMGLMVFAHFPEVLNIKAALFFIMHNVIVDEAYTRDQTDDLWAHFTPHLAMNG
jgi:CRISPR/Cas system-associated exonuclease Cas4 (RecB family)